MSMSQSALIGHGCIAVQKDDKPVLPVLASVFGAYFLRSISK